MKRLLPLFLPAFLLAGCDAFGDGMTAHTGVVARAGAHELTADQMVDMLGTNPRIPAQTEVVASVADLWVDYMILAQLAARDSSLKNLDLRSMIEPYVEQQVFMQLREQVLTADTVISEEDLRRLFEERNPGLRVRARHILIGYPDNATSSQRDSVRAFAEDIRGQVAAGGDFGALAELHSSDPGTARRGGDLGWFGPDDMVRPFWEAAARLQAGELSPVVETLFGLHVIRVDERESQSLDEMGEQFRRQAVAERQQESLDVYVTGLREPARVEVQAGAVAVARDLARRPNARLTGRAASRPLVSWRGGELTATEFIQLIRRFPPQQRAQFTAMGDEQLESVLLDMATNELVLADAARRGIVVPEAERDSIMGLLREQIVELTDEAGLSGRPQEGEAERDAVQRRVRSFLDGVLSGRHNLLPMGALQHVLRQEMSWSIHERTFGRVVNDLEEHREQQPAPTPEPPPDLELEDEAPPVPPITPPGG